MQGYCLNVDRPVAAEVRRIAQKQLGRAEHELSAAVQRFNERRVHTARQRLKKVRALLRLVRPPLGKTYSRETRPLRRIGHRLGAISDAAASASLVEPLPQRYRRLIPHSTAVTLRRSLLRRAGVTGDIAGNAQALARAARALHAEQRRSARWALRAKGFAAVSGGLEGTFRAGRRAMRRAEAHPTAGRLHDWRRRAKDQWLHLRLVKAHCRPGLAADRRALEALDGVLGACHDRALFTELVAADTTLSRAERASLLRAAHRERRRRLLTRARTLSARVYREKPKAFVRRVERLWKAR